MYTMEILRSRCGGTLRVLKGVGEPAEQVFGFLESQAGISDALTVCDGGVLTTSDQVTLYLQRLYER